MCNKSPSEQTENHGFLDVLKGVQASERKIIRFSEHQISARSERHDSSVMYPAEPPVSVARKGQAYYDDASLDWTRP